MLKALINKLTPADHETGCRKKAEQDNVGEVSENQKGTRWSE